MSRLLVRAGWRYFRARPWQLGLSLLGVALGVAVVIAVELANQSAARAFTLSSQALTGEATHQVHAGPSGLSVDWYVELRREHGLRDLAPVVEGTVESPLAPGRSLRLLGVDPLAEGGMRPALDALRGGDGLGGLLADPSAIWLLAEDLDRLGLGVGDSLPIEVHGEERQLSIAGALTPYRALDREGLRDVLIMDIAAAQELLGRGDRLDRVDLRVDDAGALSGIQSLLPADAQLLPADQRQATLQDMTSAFRINLTAFSLLALLVGAFLIYNTMSFSVVQRRTLLGQLRAIGSTRRDILRLVLTEAALIGFAGTVIGLLLGIALAQVMLDLVSRTINDLYFVLSVRSVSVSPVMLGTALLLGPVVSMLAAAVPAVEATRIPPRAVLSASEAEGVTRARMPRQQAAGLCLLAASGLVLLLPTSGLMPAFLALFLLILGAALLVPTLIALLMRPLAIVCGVVFGLPGRMAARGVRAGLSRTGIAAAALTVAVSAIIGVGAMVDSFRSTFGDWLERTLQSDLYVSVPGDRHLEPELAAELRQLDEVAQSTSALETRVADGDQRYQLRVFDLEASVERAFGVLQQGSDELDGWASGDGVLVTEPFANRHGLSPDQRLKLKTPEGERAFPVLAVVQDYGSSEGAVIMARSLYERLWDDGRIGSVGLRRAEGVSAKSLEAAVRATVGDRQAVRLRSGETLRELSLQVFDRTFTITHVLRLLATLVAVVGILSALTALALERAREHAVLRAVGLTPAQLWRLVTLQNGLIGLTAGLLALPLGVAMSAILTQVINQRAFGWSLSLHVAPGLLLEAVLLALAAGLLAGLYPAWRASRQSPAVALREEAL
ncbi:FtsX-like permease family protein [Methylonatrum kenyense]|uniref:FtsX-like permease family protein n=1 Tax=Methylonatrum kenyense TaxID=455253 RepID=UPI0020BF184A|nr:FtsX-like permease family protein [Methylonatrum kenyense]MCK8516324.1 FtsX-like permease family protein [Methylonatrum kenyense]